MKINTAELESIKGLEEGDYYKEPTFWETVEAQMQSITSVGLETSEGNYYNEQLDITSNEWKTKDPANAKLYDRIAGLPMRDVERFEDMYNNGDIEKLGSTQFISKDGMIGIGGIGIGKDYLRFKELQSQHGFEGGTEIMAKAKDKSLNDYKESMEILGKSDKWGAKIIGGIGGYAQSPMMIASLPLGGWSAGRGIIGNMLVAGGQEMAIEAGVQAVQAPIVHSYKNELGIRTSIADTATDVVLNIGTAGLIRGTGSALFDLTETGVKALRGVEPDLADDYDALFKNKIDNSNKEHLDNLERIENGEPIVIKEETDKAREVMARGEQQQYETIEKPIMDVGDEDMFIVSGRNEKGEPEFKSYNDMKAEIDDTDSYLKIAEDCLLGRG